MSSLDNLVELGVAGMDFLIKTAYKPFAVKNKTDKKFC